MSNHAWCSDIPRDEAVRAAEDNRQGPLPTPEEAIERAFGFDAASAQRACDEVKSWPEDVQKDCRFVLGDLLEQGVERLQALVTAWQYGKGIMKVRYPSMMPKSASATSAPEPENKGDGMRTERVTLEVTHGAALSASEWPMWSTIFDSRHGESVRVVEEAKGSVDEREYADRIACDEERDFANRIIAQRDAAIRERDEYRRALTVENDHALRITAERDALKARVAELESAPAASGNCKGILNGSPAASVAANSPAVPVSSEPLAYWVQWKTDTVIDKWTFQSTFPTLKVAAEYIDEYAEEDDQPEIVPLYTAPPPARGWLTEEERRAVTLAAWQAPESDFVLSSEGVWVRRVLSSLIARSTPPEVVLPRYLQMQFYGQVNGDIRKALAAAGVAVKEVGK